VANTTLTADWDLVITADRGWFSIDLKELWRYRDLIMLFVQRDLVSQYKQTILGPLYFAITPILGTLINTLIFGKIAKLSTDGVPHFLFYMSGNLFWGYFNSCLTSAKDTFTANSGIFSQVYFPRLAVPVSQSISGLVRMAVQFIVFFSFYAYFVLDGFELRPSIWIILFPLLLLQCALLGIGFGVLLSSFTTKYRDLNFVFSFLVLAWMYASPVVYPISVIPEKYRLLMSINPMVGVIESIRQILFGISSLRVEYVLIGVAVNIIFLFIGVLVFNRVEKNFLDTV
jgi:lipopolysaccharide transport system permease protein|tara:strand:- start:1598 stop:2455 length:858 start_codon:yes stop_codon:yes gene_type:complete